MANENLVQPATDIPPPVTVEPTEPQTAPAPESGDLPDNLLKIPAFQALMAGAPPAVSADIKTLDKAPEGKIISENAGPLQSAGFGFYRALDKTTGVIFNGLFVAPQQLQEADKAGRLKDLAPEFSVVNDTAARSGDINPVLTAQTPAGPPVPAAPEPPQSASGRLPAPPASAQTKLAGARARNLQPGSPTSGPAPGRGRLLNNLLKPAI